MGCSGRLFSPVSLDRDTSQLAESFLKGSAFPSPGGYAMGLQDALARLYTAYIERVGKALEELQKDPNFNSALEEILEEDASRASPDKLKDMLKGYGLANVLIAGSGALIEYALTRKPSSLFKGAKDALYASAPIQLLGLTNSEEEQKAHAMVNEFYASEKPTEFAAVNAGVCGAMFGIGAIVTNVLLRTRIPPLKAAAAGSLYGAAVSCLIRKEGDRLKGRLKEKMADIAARPPAPDDESIDGVIEPWCPLTEPEATPQEQAEDAPEEGTSQTS